MLLVLEGVITLEGATGKMVVNEGELAAAPRDVSHNAHSGMRSTVVLFEQQQAKESSNGHHGPPVENRNNLSKVNVALDVRAVPAYEWLTAGAVGGYDTFASRLWGTSAPYEATNGPLLVLVYRGVLNYATDDESGVIVGSQMLHVPSGARITLGSEHGATVLVLARSGTPMPIAAGPSVGDGGDSYEDDDSS